VKSLSQRAIKEISLELREVFILMSKLSVSLLQWHFSSMQWSSHRSIYQWIDSPISSHATSESALMTSILNAMIYSLSSLYSSVNLIIRSCATSESATMTSSKSISSMSKSISESASMTSSMQWSSHHYIYQWIDSSISSHATSESASMTSILNAMIYSLSSLYSSVNLIIHSYAASESVTMTSSKSISSMSKSISESASMTLLPCIVSLLQ